MPLTIVNEDESQVSSKQGLANVSEYQHIVLAILNQTTFLEVAFLDIETTLKQERFAVARLNQLLDLVKECWFTIMYVVSVNARRIL